jgi:predicted adenine nucleotide alpha hydrolase (AANH) superfamily ATPase
MSCCAPCSAGAIAQLAGRGADFIVLFYNPNIYPDTEYQKRLSEQIRYCEQMNVKYAIGDYEHDEWLKCAKGLESAAERGARCTECFKHRFKFGEKFAIENGYDAIASVFGVSRHKDQSQVDAAARDALTTIAYIPVKWDNEIDRNTGFYRQNYCGCEFSFRKV